MRVREIMSESPACCSPIDNLATVAGLLWRNDCGVAPVVGDGGKVVGVITDRDICMAAGTKHRPASDIRVSEVFSGKVFHCTAEDEVGVALKTMAEHRVRRLPVISQGGKLEGIVSLHDIIEHAVTPRGKTAVGITADDVMRTLKALCEHELVGSGRPEIMT